MSRLICRRFVPDEKGDEVCSACKAADGLIALYTVKIRKGFRLICRCKSCGRYVFVERIDDDGNDST